jgi:hypothetical protein
VKVTPSRKIIKWKFNVKVWKVIPLKKETEQTKGEGVKGQTFAKKAGHAKGEGVKGQTFGKKETQHTKGEGVKGHTFVRNKIGAHQR